MSTELVNRLPPYQSRPPKAVAAFQKFQTLYKPGIDGVIARLEALADEVYDLEHNRGLLDTLKVADGYADSCNYRDEIVAARHLIESAKYRLETCL